MRNEERDREFIKAKIQNLETELKQTRELEAKMEREAKLRAATEWDLADLIHEKVCIANHTDGCSYWYDKHYNRLDSDTMQHYLKKARAMLAIANIQTCMKLLECL